MDTTSSPREIICGKAAMFGRKVKLYSIHTLSIVMRYLQCKPEII